MTNPDSNIVFMGRFGAVYGVKGWLHIHSFTDPLENILRYSAWLVLHDGSWRPVKVENSNFHGNGIIAKIHGCNDRDLAKQYVNDFIGVERSQLPILETGEYYWTDLIGLSVVTTQGQAIGKIDSMMETGANDVFVVRSSDGEQLIPNTKEAIASIDLANRLMTVNWDPEF